eukprot:GHVN01098508.1.p1 GENE.GHVN01098508.1~~GHVN01098508.1.p1  ORF type:complete len:807 (+),score=92.26 GHVN01098508.1:1712-4132(+)
MEMNQKHHKHHKHKKAAVPAEKGKMARRFDQRKAEMEQRRTEKKAVPECTAPLAVAVFGSRGCGKTTLLRSLVKRYTKRKLKGDVCGPVTVFSEKNRRTTFFEVEPTLSAMLDAAKVCDVAVVVIDGQSGLLMEALELATILKAHGLPHMVGVITKLDLLSSAQKRRDAKRVCKEMFRKRVCESKMFYLTGFKGIDTFYKERETINLSLFIANKRRSEATWKATHSHMLIDKFQKKTLDTASDEISFYGYLRGMPLRAKSAVCIPGVGDFTVSAVTAVQDPCPLQEVDPKKIRKIVDRKKTVYAPMAHIDGTFEDEDAVYVNVEEIDTPAAVWRVPPTPKILLMEGCGEAREDAENTALEEDAEEADPEEAYADTADESEVLTEEQRQSMLRARFVFGEEDGGEHGLREEKLSRLSRRFDDLTKESAASAEPASANGGVDRKHFGGYPGDYVRVVIRGVPQGFAAGWQAQMPLIMGQIETRETAFVVSKVIRPPIQTRIFKTREPLLVSLGWRRFQTMPVFSLQDPTRNKMLKYTLENRHCLATFYAPYTPQGTGLCAFKNIDGKEFRVSLIGSVVEMRTTTAIQKKLKLIGQPMLVQEKTAFISGMFSSDLEVASFEGAAIRTVSGIRGIVKKAVKSEGVFRAGFEDKIMTDDVVFLRTWHDIAPPKYFNPMREMLGEWCHMLTNKKLRDTHAVALVQKEDSLYRPVEHPEPIQEKARLPRKILRNLPFKKKPAGGPTEVERYLEERNADFDPQRAGLIQSLRVLKQRKAEREAEEQKKAEMEKKKLIEKEKVKAKPQNRQKRFY